MYRTAVLGVLLASACTQRVYVDAVPATTTVEVVLDDSTDRSGDAVVAITIGLGADVELCSGSLIAPSLVLTARHCVSGMPEGPEVTCGQGGTTVGDDFPVDQMRVHIGSRAISQVDGFVGVRAILHLSGDALCNADIAIVVLSAPLGGLPTLAVRVGSPTAVGETVSVVGYGINSLGLAPHTRVMKSGIPVSFVGPGEGPGSLPVGDREFELGGPSSCPGDSGGPAISEATGEIVGVVSRGRDCTLPEGHLFTAVAPFAGLIADGFRVASEK